MRLDDLDVPWGRGIFRRTKRISFELSNLCTLAPCHAKCPAHQAREPRILPMSIVESVLETCRKRRFRGMFAFHLYNEPGVDPRLFLFMQRIKAVLPGAKLFLLTNGWYLDANLARELEAVGLDYLGISAYSDADYRRFRRLRLKIPVRVRRERPDDRLTWYAPRCSPVRPQPCYAPFYEICITSAGQVCLCPFDWQRRHVFGDLSQEPLDAILRRPEMLRVYEALSCGRRELEICTNCRTSRGEPLGTTP